MIFSKKQKFYFFIKRLLDVVLSIFGILLCFVFVWIWVVPINLFFTKGRPIFLAKRYGKNKDVFKMLKFRTMILETPLLPPDALSHEDRMKYETSFGKFLRKTSIDETPQLFNVLFGHMSLIGPRPGSVINEENLSFARENISPSPFLVRPGMTGLAQVQLKRKHNIKEKVSLDSIYVKKLSFFLDVKILFQTIKVILVK